MNRTNIFIILGVALIVLTFWLLRTNRTNTIYGISWFPSYNYEQGKMPYDIDVVVDLLKHEIPESGFHKMNAPFDTYKPVGKNGLYLAIRREYMPDYQQCRALIDYVSEGNSAFISTESFGMIFKETLIEETSFFNCQDQQEWITSAGLVADSFDVFVKGYKDTLTPSIGETQFLWSPYKVFYTNCLDTQIARPLSYTEFGSFNGLQISIGKGKLYLHSMPLILSNYNMRDEASYRHLDHLFGDLSFDELFVDLVKYRNNYTSPEHNNEELQKTPLNVLFKNRSLRTAFYLITFSALLLVVLGIRRLLPPIAIVQKPENSSIAFSRSIARLYWLHPNHRKIALKKVRFFLSEVSQRYGLEVHKTDAAFRERLSRKSGVELRHVNKLFDAWEVAGKSNKIHEDLLKQISDSVDYIRTNWK